MIHVSGMGLLGCFLARELERRGREFVWSDTGGAGAWKASTGSVSPRGAERSELAAGWRWWMGEGRNRFAPYCEVVRHVYFQAGRPSFLARTARALEHEGKRYWEAGLGVQFDVRRFVLDTRERFSALDAMSAPEPQETVFRARGVGETDPKAIPVWGWSCEADVHSVFDVQPKWRVAFHVVDRARANSHLYLYPKVGSNRYLAGSATIMQKAPKMRPNIEGDVWRAEDVLREGLANVALVRLDLGSVREGWRPKPRLAARPGPGVLPALYKSGVQCGPLAVERFLDVNLRETPCR